MLLCCCCVVVVLLLCCCCVVVVMLLRSCCDVVIESLCCCLDCSDKLFSVFFYKVADILTDRQTDRATTRGPIGPKKLCGGGWVYQTITNPISGSSQSSLRFTKLNKLN